MRSSTLKRSDHARADVQGFLPAIREVWERYSKRTSGPHKRSILLLVIAGAVLRGWMMFQPVTYDEARAYDLIISRTIGAILTDQVDPLNHVFHSLLARISISLFGTGLVAMRLPAFLAAVLALPLFYLFTRAMFNRYIAMIALALVASSAPLIEYGALAHGYSITWFCMIAGLAMGRHLTRANDRITAIILGAVLALGMWSMTGMIYPALMIYLWLFFHILMRHEGSVRSRLNMVLLSITAFFTITLLLYLPVILEHGIGHLWDHPSLPERNWKSFTRSHQDGAFDLWVSIVDTTGSWVALAGLIALMVSAFISSKYRILMFAMALGAILLVLFKARVGPPPVWYYSLFLFHIGTAIALFYLLKFIQEKVFTGLGKRSRTWAASMLIFAAFAVMGIRVIKDRVPRFPEAKEAGLYLAEAMEPEDRVYVDHPWDLPVRFHAMSGRLPRDRFQGEPAIGGWAFMVIAPVSGRGVGHVLADQRMDQNEFDEITLVNDRGRIEIFAARYRGPRSTSTDTTRQTAPQGGFEQHR